MTVQEAINGFEMDNLLLDGKEDGIVERNNLAITALQKRIPLQTKEFVRQIRDFENVSIICPVCGWDVNHGDKYCGHCGQALIN